MNEFVTDTHPIIWHLSNDRRLSSLAKQTFVAADAGQYRVLVPGIVLIEMVYLVEKGRIPRLLLEHLMGLLRTPNSSYQVAILDQSIAHAMLNYVPWPLVPEIADRIITTTAFQLGLPVISRDERIQKSKIVPCVW